MIDTHVHLDFEPLRRDLPAVLARARAAGVGGFVLPAYAAGGWDAVAEIAAAHDDVFPALGVHPWKAHEGVDIDALRDRLRACRTVAVGEIGLDTKIEGPGLDVQLPVFRDQLRLARELDLPVILHCRGAFDKFIAELAAEGPVRGVVHAFSRGPELARRILDLGLHIGLGGAITRPRARRSRHGAGDVPLDSVVLETDAPGLGMAGIPDGENEPGNVRAVAAALAELRGMTVDEIAVETTRNARELFRLS
ncbi:TatD family hydrolase [bacterium]|nr:TatD family hydrolase [bacterium]MBU1074216.1 TatD family hydrolase [bacterium]MBU1676751.1 TatD family hydrolase [bacterium]